jgi:hypothetical protein
MEPLVRGAREQFSRISVWRAGFLRVLSQTGKLDEARAELDVWLREGLPDPLADSNGVITLVLLGELCWELSASEAAHEIVKRLESYAGENAAPAFGAVCFGSVDQALGWLALTLGRADEALDRMRSAERASERQGARPALAHVRLGIAHALRKRGAPGDVAAAREVAGSAAALAESLGMAVVAARARLL